jgi:HK97 gp10 family phage protein
MSGTQLVWYGEERQKEIKSKLERNMQKAVLIVERDAKINASGRPGPKVDTGRLRASITTEVEKTNNDIVGRVGTNVVYSKFLEHGTSRMPPYPFLFPALEVNKEHIKELLKDD